AGVLESTQGQAVTAAVTATAARFRRRCSNIATEPITSDSVLARPLGSISGTPEGTGTAPARIATPGVDSYAAE
ncbi:MAG: hypothetical protein WCH79_19480, partial [Planctomycetia bacterium]